MSSSPESQARFEATFMGFLYRQFTRPRRLSADTNLTGQVAIVTGSNTGLGFEASRQLLEFRLSHLIIGVRSQTKGDEAAKRLSKEYPAAKITVWTVDMESYDSICAFTDRCATLSRIDIAILNAALIKTSYTEASAGHEVSMQVNYLSTALLAILLLPILRSKKAAGAQRPPVLSIVGSDMAYLAKIGTKGPILQQFDTPNGYAQLDWYGRAKMLLAFFVARLAETVGPEVLINMPNPGTCGGTSFFREWSTLSAAMVAVLQFIFARSVENGASMYLDAAISRGLESHGCFLSDWTIKPYPSLWYTAEGAEFSERLWEETLEELNFAGASKIIEEAKRARQQALNALPTVD